MTTQIKDNNIRFNNNIMENRKLCHLHLEDYIGNKYTLICRLKDESINYVFYSGWSSSGMPNALSNLQCTLPVYPDSNETEEMFVEKIVDTINDNSVKKVVKAVPVKVEFA